MTILAGFPIYNTPDVTRAAIASLGSVDTFFVVNNPDLEELVESSPHRVNRENNYCNGAWNQIMAYFLKGTWEWLLLSSSDVIMGPRWQNNIPDMTKTVWLPDFAPNLELLKNWDGKERELIGQPAGACTLYPRAAVALVYPIPAQLRHWFGDEYCYRLLREKGWEIRQAPFTAFHYGSLGSDNLNQLDSIIALDKQAWDQR